MNSEDMMQHIEDSKLAELTAKLEFLEGYSKGQDERIAELEEALKALVDQTIFVFYDTVTDDYHCLYCEAESPRYTTVAHAPDCAWERARWLV